MPPVVLFVVCACVVTPVAHELPNAPRIRQRYFANVPVHCDLFVDIVQQNFNIVVAIGFFFLCQLCFAVSNQRVIQVAHKFFNLVRGQVFGGLCKGISRQNITVSELDTVGTQRLNGLAFINCKDVHPFKILAHELKFKPQIVNVTDNALVFGQVKTLLQLLAKVNELFPRPS